MTMYTFTATTSHGFTVEWMTATDCPSRALRKACGSVLHHMWLGDTVTITIQTIDGSGRRCPYAELTTGYTHIRRLLGR